MKERTTCEFPQFGELRKLFGNKRPSVNLFEQLLSELSPDKQKQYYQMAFFLFLNAYPTVTKHYRYFLTNLVKQKPDKFLDYLFRTSGLGELRCKMENRELLIQIFHILTAKKGNVKSSLPLLAFSISLGFETALQTNILGEYIRKYRFYPETFFELAEYVGIHIGENP